MGSCRCSVLSLERRPDIAGISAAGPIVLSTGERSRIPESRLVVVLSRRWWILTANNRQSTLAGTGNWNLVHTNRTNGTSQISLLALPISSRIGDLETWRAGDAGKAHRKLEMVDGLDPLAQKQGQRERHARWANSFSALVLK